MLEVAGVHKSYSDTVALAGVDLTIEAGEVVAVIGPNGAGKTTLMSIIAGLRKADAGTVTVAGIDVDAHPRRVRPLLGIAPQELGVYPPLTAYENLLYFAELAGLRRGAARARVEETAEALDLSSFLDKQVQHLSGGQKRRVHAALALVHRPRLILLDEPTAGVDVQTRSRLIEVVRSLAEAGAAVCYTTHYLPEVEALEARVAILHRGLVVAAGSIPELVTTRVAAALRLTFSGSAPLIELPPPHEVRVDGDILHIRTPDPARDAAVVLAALGADVARLSSLEVVKPSLEAVFVELISTTDDEASIEEEDAA